jgi:hypothetical protein
MLGHAQRAAEIYSEVGDLRGWGLSTLMAIKKLQTIGK